MDYKDEIDYATKVWYGQSKVSLNEAYGLSRFSPNKVYAIVDRFHGDSMDEVRSDNPAFNTQAEFFDWVRQHGNHLEEVYEVAIQKGTAHGQ